MYIYKLNSTNLLLGLKGIELVARASGGNGNRTFLIVNDVTAANTATDYNQFLVTS